MARQLVRGHLAVIFFVVLGILSSSALFAQSTTEGAIGGVVTDQTRAVLPGATVTAKNVATNVSGTTPADASGRFTVIHLQPGVYTVEVRLNGFASSTRDNVIVEVGRVTNLEVTLSVSAVSETLTVLTEAPVINTETPDLSTNINQTTIANLPVNARRWSQYALQTPGAAPDGTFGLISFRGISGLLNGNTVDGGDNTQAFFSEERGRTRLSYSLGLGAVREFQVNTSDYSAEYGRAAGGVVNAVTKSGTNKFEGDGFYYIRDSSMSSSNPFNTEQVLVNGVYTSVGIKPDDRRQQFGGSFGGPIQKDKLFFFVNYDQQTRNFPGVAVPSNPTAFFAPLSATETATLVARGVSAAQAASGLAFIQGLTGVVPRTGDQNLLFPKIDWQLSDNNLLNVSYNHLRWNSPAGIQTSSTVFRGVEAWGNDFVSEDWAIARLTSIFGSRFTNEIRFQWGRDFEYETSQPAVAGEPVVPGTTRSPDVFISNPSFEFGKPTFLERRAYPDERRIQVSDTATVLDGRHLFRFGVDINRTSDLLDNLFEEGGSYSYNNRVDFISDYELNTQLGGAGRFYSSFNQGIGPTAFQLATVDYAAFVQDAWHVHPRLTLNLGLRYDFEQMPSPQIPNPLSPLTAAFPSDKNNFGPRVGANWDVSGKGDTLLRGGWGVYYGRIINSTISNAITNTGVGAGQLALTVLNNQAGAPTYPNIIANASASPSKPSIVYFAPDTQNPTIYEYDLILEQRVARNTVVSVSYVGSKGHHLPVFLDQNLNPPTSSLTYLASGGPLDGQSVTVPFFTLPRPNANFNQMTEIFDGVDSSYNAVVLALNRRLTNGLQIQASYTYSHATDDGQSSQTFTASNNVLNPQNLSLEQGTSSFDVPHRAGVALVWQVANFTIAPVFGISSGAPYTPSLTGNAPPTTRVLTGILGDGGTNRLPSIARNSYRLPYTTNTDFRIARTFKLQGRLKAEALAEVFNLFNRLNYTAVNSTFYAVGGTAAAPTLTYQAATFGTLTNANNGTFAPSPRQVQLALRFTF
jgi:Carboxypeptidase regulatory-like domain/TonB dependent receptor